MAPATDSAKMLPSRVFGIGLALSTLLADPGCARLRSFRQDDRPAFGTETASKPASAEKSIEGQAPLIALQPPVSLRSSDPAKSPENASQAEPERPPVSVVAAASATPANAPTLALASALAESRKRLDALTSYRVKMSHQERVGGRLNPVEDVILSVRREPQAVRLEWPEGSHKGREVIFAPGSNGGLMQIHMANSPLPRLSIPPDSPLALSNSRHPITEAGFDTIIANMERAFQRQVAGDGSLGKIRFIGEETPPGFDRPCEKIVRVTPENESWVVFLDGNTRLPVLVEAKAGNGDLLEHYEFRDPAFDLPDLALADAFDPDARWGKSMNLFQRLARGGSEVVKDSKSR